MGIKNKNSLLHSTAAAILSLCLLCTSVPQLSALGGADGDPEYFYASPREAMSGLVGAEKNGSITVIHDVDSRLYESTTDLIEDNQTVGWTGSGIGVSKTDASSVYPYRSLYGGLCLSLDYPRSAESFIYREYQKYEMSDEYVISPGPASGSPEGIDFHSVHTVSFALNLCSEESETFFIEIYVSDYLVYTERFTVSGSGWNAVYADISAAHSSIYGPASIGRISVGIENGSGTGRGQVLLDGLAFSTSDAAQRYLMLTDGISAEGGALDLPAVTPEGDDLSLNLTELREESFAGCTSLSVALMHSSPLTEITCSFINGESYTSTQQPYSPLTFQPESGNVTVYTFALPEQAPDTIRLNIRGAVAGEELYLLALTPASLPCSDNLLSGSCESCKYSPSTGEIGISGTVSPEVASKYSGSKIYIYALNIWQNSDPSTLSPLSPVASVPVSETFSLKLRVDSYQTKKFTAVIRTGSGMITVFRDRYVSTAAGASDRQSVSSAPVKGICGDPTDAELLGSGCAVIELDISALFSPEPTEKKLKVGDTEFYFSPEALSALDSRIFAYDGTGAAVLLKILIPSDSTEGASLLSSGIRGGRYSSLSIDSELSVNAYTAAVKLLTDRYGSDRSALSGFVVGGNADTPLSTNYTKETELSAYSARCAEILRLTYLASDGSVPVYLPLGEHFRGGITADGNGSYPSGLLLASVAAETQRGGNFPWSVFLSLPVEPCENETCSDCAMTVSDVLQLCAALSSPSQRYLDVRRRVSVYAENTATDRSDDSVAAGLLYSYLSLIGKEASPVGEFICSQELLTPGLSEVLKYMDAADAPERFSRYAGIYRPGSADWYEILGENTASGVTKNVTAVSVISELPPHSGSAELFQLSDSSNDGWRSGTGCNSLSVGDILGHRNTLIAKFEDTARFSHRIIRSTFEYTRDLSSFDYLSFDAFVSQLPDSVKATELDILLFSGNSCLTASCLITPGEWNTVTVPLGDYPDIKTVDRMTIMLRGERGTYIGSPTMMISSPIGVSTKYTSNYLENFLTAERAASTKTSPAAVPLKILIPVIVVFLLCVLLLIVRAVRRDAYRRTGQNTAQSQRYPKEPR